MKNAILFHDSSSFFSNFSPHCVLWQGHNFVTAEHAYQAWKFFRSQESRIFISIVNANSPEIAKETAQRYKQFRNPKWNEVKLEKMELILRSKLQQHPDKHAMLIASYGKLLIENSKTDSFWGWGPDKDGENHSGRIWMKLRAELIAEKMASRKSLDRRT